MWAVSAIYFLNTIVSHLGVAASSVDFWWQLPGDPPTHVKIDDSTPSLCLLGIEDGDVIVVTDKDAPRPPPVDPPIGAELPIRQRRAFSPQTRFSGARAGYIFKRGEHGLGYYRDTSATHDGGAPVSCTADFYATKLHSRLHLTKLECAQARAKSNDRVAL